MAAAAGALIGGQGAGSGDIARVTGQGAHAPPVVVPVVPCIAAAAGLGSSDAPPGGLACLWAVRVKADEDHARVAAPGLLALGALQRPALLEPGPVPGAPALAPASGDRLHAVWRMALYGGRREELCGARWEQDIDLEARTWTVNIVRVVVDGKVVVKEAPKSERSARTLPLDDALVAALTALHKRQAAEKLAAGPAYRDSGYVACDELGQAVNPEWLSDEFSRVRERAGVRRITLHETRHTAASLMEKAGVPDSIRAAWCGHTIEVSKSTYTHPLPEDLAAARDALSRLYGATGS